MRDVIVERTTASDIDAILALAKANDEAQGGELSVHLDSQAIFRTMQEIPSIVARKDGRVVGFLLAWEKSTFAAGRVKAMLRVYPGGENAYVYGPIAVDAALRGLGIAAAMFEELKRLVPGREGILFIKADNEVSLRAHRKMGMRQVAAFQHQGTDLLVFNYQA
jgi:predicted GNAT superfamily acetyltransferase